jgi:hypothetical protein
MLDVFSFMSRELIGGTTLLPSAMKEIGFEPTHQDSNVNLNRPMFSRSGPSNFGCSHRAHLADHHNMSVHSSAQTPAIHSAAAPTAERDQLRLEHEARDGDITVPLDNVEAVQSEQGNSEERADILTDGMKAQLEHQLSEMKKAKEEFETKYKDAMVTYFFSIFSLIFLL